MGYDEPRGNGFRRLEIRGWRQFDEVELDFSRRLTIITGANGAGKTTMLTLLTQHFGWNATFLSEPRLEKSGGLRFFSGLRRRLQELREPAGPGQQQIGELQYATGERAFAVLPEDPGSAVFNVSFQPMR